jgi:hypothetical protein
MASKRTRLRTGKLVYLERVEGVGEIRYYVGGKNPTHQHNLVHLQAAIDWFEGVENGDRPERF